jgi:uncharacterized membrane protein (UPF0127 family)
MYNRIQLAILILLIPLGGAYLLAQHEGKTIMELFEFSSPIVHVGEIPIKVEIADTQELRTKGLSHRDELEGVNGMFFLFDTVDRHSIWMKDMRFPIDVIWVDENLKVVGIDRGVQPESYPKKYFAPVPVRFVIETEDRFTETFGIAVGHSVRLPLEIERKIAK